jgi:hypothetical protein
MATRKVEAPSGLKGVVRGLKGKEANVLADKVLARRLGTFDKILESCWVETEDGGPLAGVYLGTDGAPDWGKVLLGDRMFVLLQIRIATRGADYSFKHKCSSCDESYEWGLNLDKDLRVEKYSEAALRTYQNDNRFEAEMPDGTKFWFSLSNGDDERDAAKRIKKKKDELVTVSLSERIIEIEGIGTNKKAIRAFLEEVDLDDQYEIIDTMDEADAGVVTDIEVECPECGNEDLVRLPFVGDFWISQRRRRKRAVGEG